jgi:hypothetical protein
VQHAKQEPRDDVSLSVGFRLHSPKYLTGYSQSEVSLDSMERLYFLDLLHRVAR